MAWLRRLLPWLFIVLLWDASPSVDVTGYKIYYTDRTDHYVLDVGDVLTVSIDIPPGRNWYFYATAYNAAGNESVPSNEVSTEVSKPVLEWEIK